MLNPNQLYHLVRAVSLTISMLLFVPLLGGCSIFQPADGPKDFPSQLPQISTPDVTTPRPPAAQRPTNTRPVDGKHRWDNGAGLSYDGEWRDGEFHGQGTLREPTGERYVGEWEYGKRSGTGKQYRADGGFFDGSWEFNQPHGAGTRKYSFGVIMTGLWIDDAIANGLVELQSGHTYAGPLYTEQNTQVSARYLEWLTDLSTRGDRWAQYLLAQCYRGFEKPLPEATKRTHWLTQSAQQGLAQAQYELAMLVEGSARMELLQSAAAQHHEQALTALAQHIYRHGDRAEARALITRAAKLRYLPARIQLAWWIATDSDSDVTLAREAISLVRDIAITSQQWQYLDTLAAALARLGDYDSALVQQAAALQSAANEPEQIIEKLRAREHLYQQRQPFTAASGEHP